jgi:hypothetical protein
MGDCGAFRPVMKRDQGPYGPVLVFEVGTETGPFLGLLASATNVVTRILAHCWLCFCPMSRHFAPMCIESWLLRPPFVCYSCCIEAKGIANCYPILAGVSLS